MSGITPLYCVPTRRKPVAGGPVEHSGVSDRPRTSSDSPPLGCASMRSGRRARACAGVAFGVLIVGGTAVASLLLGGNYLDYSVLAAETAKGQHLGIFIVEFGVGLTVASVMIVIFFAFAGRDHQMDEIEE